MVYVISDLHGNLWKFYELLKRIQFSDSDVMYILGDAIDRGPDGILLLQTIMKMPNVHMIMGNHEYMFLSYLLYGKSGQYVDLMDLNGNRPTREAFLRLDKQMQYAIVEYLKSLPTHLEVSVNGEHFYLVHAFPGETIKEKLWTRPDINAPNPIPDCQLIVGHTPVLFLGRSREEEQSYIKELQEKGEHLKIYHGNGFIDIDCGCGYEIPVCALGCLRLDDMKEFYVC